MDYALAQRTRHRKRFVQVTLAEEEDTAPLVPDGKHCTLSKEGGALMLSEATLNAIHRSLAGQQLRQPTQPWAESAKRLRNLEVYAYRLALQGEANTDLRYAVAIDIDGRAYLADIITGSLYAIGKPHCLSSTRLRMVDHPLRASRLEAAEFVHTRREQG